MKNVVIALCLAINALCVNVYADVYTGPTTLRHKTIQLLTIIGVATLEDITSKVISVTGPIEAKELKAQLLTVTGPCNVQESEIVSATITGPTDFDAVTIQKKLQVTGPVHLTSVNVGKKLKVTGSLVAKKSEFTHVSVVSETTELEDTKLNTLFIKMQPAKKQQIVCLSGYTSVKKIEFESGLGQVVVTGNNVKIGQIKGGTCKRK